MTGIMGLYTGSSVTRSTYILCMREGKFTRITTKLSWSFDLNICLIVHVVDREEYIHVFSAMNSLPLLLMHR